MSRRVVAFDPGYTTGYCVINITGLRKFDVVRSGEILWDNRFAKTRDLIEDDADEVVAEDFRLYKHAASSQVNSTFPSAKVIGIIDTWCWLFDRTLILEPASVRQNVQVPPEHKIHLMSSPHAVDAYRHARYYVLRYSNAPTPKNPLPLSARGDHSRP